MKKRMIIMLSAVGIVFGGVIGFQQFKAYMMGKWLASRGQPPATVTAMNAAYQEWLPEIRSVGTLRAQNGVDVVNELAGVVRTVQLKAGALVKAGDALVDLDSDVEQARLDAAKAAADLAALTYKRDLAQFKVRAVSQAQLDLDQADLKAKRAQVNQLQAVLDKMSIKAPFAGRVGVSTVSIGQYLPAASTVVSLQASDTILVDFSVPQSQVALLAVGQKVELKSNAFPEGKFVGEVSAIDSKVDAATRNVKIEAKLDNQDGKLLPGMFAEVFVQTGKAKSYLTLPQTAITYNAYGSTLFVARAPKQGEEGAKPTAEQVFVTTGPSRGDQIAVLSGIADGTLVVTSGQMKLKNGTPLIINNSHPPANEAAPTPQEH